MKPWNVRTEMTESHRTATARSTEATNQPHMRTSIESTSSVVFWGHRSSSLLIRYPVVRIPLGKKLIETFIVHEDKYGTVFE